jgi:hypothetical protein
MCIRGQVLVLGKGNDFVWSRGPGSLIVSYLAGKKVFIGYLMQHFAHQGVGFNTGDLVAHLLNIQQLNIGKNALWQ